MAEIVKDRKILKISKTSTMAEYGKILAIFIMFPLHKLKNPFFLTI